MRPVKTPSGGPAAPLALAGKSSGPMGSQRFIYKTHLPLAASLDAMPPPRLGGGGVQMLPG